MTADLKLPALSCDLRIDRPGAYAHNELVLSGWAVSPNGATGVIVDIDDRPLNASFGLDTPELATRMEGVPGAERAGYSLRVDTSEWEPGPRRIGITAFDRVEASAAIVGTVTVRPFEPVGSSVEERLARIEAGTPVLGLDWPRLDGEPRDASKPTEIFGWAYAETGIEAVIVTVDGCFQHEALRPIARPDLLGDYGSKIALDSGFVSQLHDTETRPGRHSLTVVALGRDGKAVGIEGEIVYAEHAGGAAVEIPPLDPEPGDEEDPDESWRQRARLAEASAARSRAEARLVLEHQRSFARVWRELEEKAAEFDPLNAELASRTSELERCGAELAGVTGSLSWRITKPLRGARRLLRRRGR